jgi:hypothetical protein
MESRDGNALTLSVVDYAIDLPKMLMRLLLRELQFLNNSCQVLMIDLEDD